MEYVGLAPGFMGDTKVINGPNSQRAFSLVGELRHVVN